MRSPREQRRESLIELTAEHLLQHGLAGASLRPLAAAAGTSDRMLLYYFRDKDELLGLGLETVARRITRALDLLLADGERRTASEVLEVVWSALASEDVQGFMHLWLDLAAASARGVEPHRTVAGRIADGFVAWLQAHLNDADPGTAAALLAVIEGGLVLNAVGRRGTADAAVAQARARWAADQSR